MIGCQLCFRLVSHVRKPWLTHWGRVTHIFVGNLTIIGSDNGLLPGRHQAIIWTNTGILLIGNLGTNFSEISIEILTFSFNEMRLKLSSAKWRPFCLGLNVLTNMYLYPHSTKVIQTPESPQSGAFVVLRWWFMTQCLWPLLLWGHNGGKPFAALMLHNVTPPVKCKNMGSQSQ